MPAKKPTPGDPLTPWQAWVRDASSEETLRARIIAGESLTAIAKSLNAGLMTLSDWIAADSVRSARVHEARKAAAASYDDQALEAIRNAKDPFELAKAKEESHHLRWKASKANPREYGEKLDVTQTTTLKTASDESILAKLAALGLQLHTESGAIKVAGIAKPGVSPATGD